MGPIWQGDQHRRLWISVASGVGGTVVTLQGAVPGPRAVEEVCLVAFSWGLLEMDGSACWARPPNILPNRRTRLLDAVGIIPQPVCITGIGGRAWAYLVEGVFIR